MAAGGDALCYIPMERKHYSIEPGFLDGNRSRWPNNLGYCSKDAEVGLGPRWRVHPGTDGNPLGVVVCSYPTYDQSSRRLDLACHILPAASDDSMDGDPEWDDFLSTLGHDSFTSSCTLAAPIGGKVSADLANGGWPSIRAKALSRTKISCRRFEHRLLREDRRDVP